MSIRSKTSRVLKILEQKGFLPTQHASTLFVNVAMRQQAFRLQEERKEADGKLYLEMCLNTDLHMSGLYLESYSARWVPTLASLHGIVNGSDLARLEQKISQYNWTVKGPLAYRDFFAGNPVADKEAGSLLSELFGMADGRDTKGMQARDQLVYTYMMGTGIEWYMDCHAIKSQFEVLRYYHAFENMPSVQQAWQELREGFTRQQRSITLRYKRKLHVGEMRRQMRP